MSCYEAFSIVAQFSVVAATVAYVVFARRQWEEIRRQADIATEGIKINRMTAEAAQQSAEVAKDSLRLTERAWLDVTFDQPFQPKPGEVHPITLIIKNIGHTVAFLKTRKIQAKHWEMGFLPDRKLEPKPTEDLPALDIIFPAQALVIQSMVRIALTSESIAGFPHGDFIFDVYGLVVYDDIFSERHVTRFCQVFNGNGGFEFPREPKPGYNDAD